MDIKTLTRRTLLDFCARAATGHAVAEPTIPLMKSRRRIASPEGSGVRRLLLTGCDYSRDLRSAEWGPIVIVRGNNSQDRMSSLGQKQTLDCRPLMSALQKRTLLN